MGADLPPEKKHPGREPSYPPPRVTAVTETKSDAAQVAEFRTSRYQVSLPAVVVTGLITAMSGAFVAWMNKPAPSLQLTPAQDAALQSCAGLAKDVAELKATVRWIEPQIGILLVRTDTRVYSPPPRP